jgi:hypothetical protein
MVRNDGPMNVDNRGLTGIVVPASMALYDPLPEWQCDMVVRVDRAYKGASGLMTPAGTCVWTRGDRWEPIIPEGAMPGSWEECVWKPETSNV